MGAVGVLILLFVGLLSKTCMSLNRFGFIINICYLAMTSMTLYLIQLVFFDFLIQGREGTREHPKDMLIVYQLLRVVFQAIAEILGAWVLWKFALKYKHVAAEIPLMYEGQLSHMESSRRFGCLNVSFLLFLLLANLGYGYFNYWFL
jgi:hypothetical protein